MCGAAGGFEPRSTANDFGVLLFSCPLIADGLDAIAGLDYLRPLIGTIAEAEAGNLSEARADLRELKESDQFKAHARIAFELAYELAEKAENPEQYIELMATHMPAILTERMLTDVLDSTRQAEVLEEARRLQKVILSAVDRSSETADEEQQPAL